MKFGVHAEGIRRRPGFGLAAVITNGQSILDSKPSHWN